MVRAFRKTYPQARLTWLAESHTRNLIEHHPELDEVLVWDRNGWKRLWKERKFGELIREARSLVAALRKRRFDLAVDMQGLLRSGIMTFLSGAPVRIGLRPKEGSQIFMTRVVDRHRNKGNQARISSEYLYLAQELGLDTEEFRMEVPLSAEDLRFARDWKAEEGLETGYAVAIPFTTRPQKHWFEDRWAALLETMDHELSLPPVVLGGPGDQEALERIRAATGIQLRSLVGTTSLTQPAPVIRGATLVVAVDTGHSHIAIAYDRPTVTIFGSNIPYTEPPTKRAKVLVHWLECSPCKGNPTCNGEYTCMRLIQPHDVLTAAREVMAQAKQEMPVEAEGDSPAPSTEGWKGLEEHTSPPGGGDTAGPE